MDKFVVGFSSQCLGIELFGCFEVDVPGVENVWELAIYLLGALYKVRVQWALDVTL